MKKNNLKINSQEYWDKRFLLGDWGRTGRIQTAEYAKANVRQMSVSEQFDGSILDWGCAEGDALRIYSEYFPNAKLFGFDISASAIEKCKERYKNIATFSCDENLLDSNFNIIVASHVMEHLSNDKYYVSHLLKKCEDLYIIVPYRENPLYFEHVNYYDDDYYENFNVVNSRVFDVEYKARLNLKSIIKYCLKLKPKFYSDSFKKIILFHIKGTSFSHRNE